MARELGIVANFAEVASPLLLTEYRDVKVRKVELEKVEKAMRDEIETRLNAGLEVANDKAYAELSTVNYKTYSVTKAISAIRKYKIDAAAILKVVNKAVEALPAEILATIPFVTEPTTRLNVKARK